VIVMMQRALLPVASAQVSLAGSESYNTIDWRLVNYGNSLILYALAGIGALLSVIVARWRVTAVAGWIATLLLLANPTLFGLPPSWFINNHSVMITLFMPVSVLAAYCVDQLVAWLLYYTGPRWRRRNRYALAVGFIGVALLGTWQLRTVINPVTVLAQPVDLKALTWAAEHTPPDARFLVNSTHWLSGSPRGTDAGWWLLPLAGRWVSTPPALYIFGSPEYKYAVDRLNQRVAALQPNAAQQLAELVRDEHITHIFIGKQGGPIKPDLLFGDPAYDAIYDQDGVTIFAVRASS
jgi:hypothetical protein